MLARLIRLLENAIDMADLNSRCRSARLVIRFR